MFDIEVYEHDSDKILEIGFIKFGVQPGATKEHFHYIITDNLQYINDSVKDNRDNFQFGESERLSLSEATTKFQEHIAKADSLVTHSGSNDEQFLLVHGVRLQGKQMFDTQVVKI